MTRAALLLLALVAGCRDWEKFSDAPCVADGGPAGCVAIEACGVCLLECDAQDWDYAGAVSLCGDWGGHVAEPRTVALNECFHETVRREVPQFFVGAIQGAGQPTPADAWTWATDGEPVDTLIWAENNPADEDGTENDAENCSGFTRNEAGMNDIHCEFFPTGVLCERPLPE